MAGDAAAAARVPALFKEYQLRQTLSSTLIYHKLHGNEPPPHEDDSGDEGDSDDE